MGKLIKAVRDKPDSLDGFSTYTITNLLGADDEKVFIMRLADLAVQLS